MRRESVTYFFSKYAKPRYKKLNIYNISSLLHKYNSITKVMIYEKENKRSSRVENESVTTTGVRQIKAIQLLCVFFEFFEG